MSNLRILIVDDNPQSHQDFIKVFSFDNAPTEIDTINAQIFSETKPNTDIQLVICN